MAQSKLAWWKILAILGIFLVLHFSYRQFPNVFFQIIAEKEETVFSHMKMLFFAYLLTTLIEFFLQRAKIKSVETFFYSRALIAVAFPWLTITLWFTAWALAIDIPARPWETIYANVVTLIGIYLALRMEELFANVELRPSLQRTILLVFIAALLSYVAFSLNPPTNFFNPPPG